MTNKTHRLSRLRKWMLRLGLLTAVLYIVLQPYFVSRSFRRAYRERDFAKAESFVDFPTLRENLLQRAKQKYVQPAKRDQAASMYNLAHAFMRKMIDSTVRPGGFEAFAKMSQSQSDDGDAAMHNVSVDLHAWNTYEGLSVFSTEIYARRNEETVPVIKLYFRRVNLSWKLYDATLFGEI
ncbi:hypothetical protein RMSM_06584 [Rhodopirellula maiorica SM1]|uniref:Uncharacterized protein n=1 Tax=Rhodopirellula maiorica SM1 TaxID=1265738 RepID=M5RAT7_9BACT|nr:DUF2939 domain-containing protein [Rhodopirellula maiorica]EMI16490.1 hypothetical protein RMSM_06584 [Rhodopirellula maiorica SM1]